MRIRHSAVRDGFSPAQHAFAYANFDEQPKRRAAEKADARGDSLAAQVM